VLCVAWAFAVAYFTRRFIDWQNVGIFWKIVVYGAGGYIAIPNYGLFRQDSIPHEMQGHHQAITTFSLVTYVVSSVLLAFLIQAK
jgi:hypothetical protein